MCDLKSLHDQIFKQAYALFGGEDLAYPGFIEFDDARDIILTKSATTSTYKLWDMHNWKVKALIRRDNVEEARLTENVLLLIQKPEHYKIPCELQCVSTGNMLTSANIELQRKKKIEYFELFNEYLLIKQEANAPVIINLITKEKIVLHAQTKANPSAFIFLHKKNMQVTVHQLEKIVRIQDFKGNILSEFNLDRNLDKTNLYIDRSQRYIFLLKRNIRPLPQEIMSAESHEHKSLADQNWGNDKQSVVSQGYAQSMPPQPPLNQSQQYSENSWPHSNSDSTEDWQEQEYTMRLPTCFR